MHVQHDMKLQEETSRLEKHFEDMKCGVASLFEDFAGGRIDSANLLVQFLPCNMCLTWIQHTRSTCLQDLANDLMQVIHCWIICI